MRVAYLFRERYPNYDLDFSVFEQLTPEELRGLDTLVRTGCWRFHPSSEDIDGAACEALGLFYSGAGAVFKLKDEDFLQAALTTPIYAVQFVTLGYVLACQLDSRLRANPDYLGFSQVLPLLKKHLRVFDGAAPRYEIRRGQIYVLFSSTTDDEWLADEIFESFSSKSNSLSSGLLLNSLSKRDVRNRFTIFDAEEDVAREFRIGGTIQTLAEEWEAHSEVTLYALQASVPEALDEFIQAVEVLSKPSLNSADCANVAVNLRRMLEKVTDKYYPGSDQRRPGWMMKTWKENLDRLEGSEEKYGQYIEAEVGDILTRLEATLGMTNKGVHEDWDPRVFRTLALRIMLLIHELRTLRPGVRAVRLDPRLFNQVNDDQA